jgi:hypothetical protein
MPCKMIGNIEKRHKDFSIYEKQLYMNLAREYPAKFKKL